MSAKAGSMPSAAPSDAERADPGRVDEERTARQADELAVGGRVAAAGVVLADRGRPLALLAQQRVDERRLADARRAEHDRRAATTQVGVPEALDPVAGERGHGPHLDARSDGLGRDPEPFDVVATSDLLRTTTGVAPPLQATAR